MLPLQNEFSFIIVSLHFPNEYVKIYFVMLNAAAKCIYIDGMHRGRKSERYPWNRKTEEKCLWNICHMVPVYITNSLQQFSFRSLLLAMKSRAFDVTSVCRVCALDSHSLSLCLSRFLSFSLLLFLWSHIKRCARCISLVVRSKIVFITLK